MADQDKNKQKVIRRPDQKQENDASVEQIAEVIDSLP